MTNINVYEVLPGFAFEKYADEEYPEVEGGSFIREIREKEGNIVNNLLWVKDDIESTPLTNLRTTALCGCGYVVAGDLHAEVQVVYISTDAKMYVQDTTWDEYTGNS